MIYQNNKEWKDWIKELGGTFKMPKGGVKFYLTDVYKGSKMVDDKTVHTFPESYALPPAYTTIKDGAAVEIRYVTKPTVMRGKSGKTEGVEIGYFPTEIVFRNGVLLVKRNELDLYYFLSTHPRCETNESYFSIGADKKRHLDDAKIGLALSSFSHFIFRERNEILEQEIAYDKQSNIIKAKHYIVNDITEGEAIAIYKTYENDYDDEMPISRVKNYLLVKAEEDPKDLMDQLNSEVRTIKTKVNEAIAAEIIFFDKKKGIWKWSGPETENSKIISVPKGKQKDPVSPLVTYIRDVDSTDLLEEITKAVKKAEEAELEEE